MIAVEVGQVPEWEDFALPVSGETPAGPSVRFDPLWGEIATARSADDPSLPRGDWVRVLKKADWAEVIRLSSALLIERSKDLRIAVWLMEAWVHEEGFRGVAWGFELLWILSQRFWEFLHPEWDPDDVLSRAGPFDWVDQNIPPIIRSIPIAKGESGLTYTWGDWLAVQYWERVSLRPAGAEGAPELAPTRESFQLVVGQTPSDFYLEIIAHVAQAEETAGCLERFLDGKFGSDGPSLRSIRAELAEIHRWAEIIVSEREEPEQQPPKEIEMTNDEAPAEESIRSRAEAYAKLIEAADFLLRTEPHSPVPYLVKRAVAWGEMPLANLFQEFLQEGLNLEAVCHLLGIQESDTT